MHIFSRVLHVLVRIHLFLYDFRMYLSIVGRTLQGGKGLVIAGPPRSTLVIAGHRLSSWYQRLLNHRFSRILAQKTQNKLIKKVRHFCPESTWLHHSSSHYSIRSKPEKIMDHRTSDTKPHEQETFNPEIIHQSKLLNYLVHQLSLYLLDLENDMHQL